MRVNRSKHEREMQKARERKRERTRKKAKVRRSRKYRKTKLNKSGKILWFQTRENSSGIGKILPG